MSAARPRTAPSRSCPPRRRGTPCRRRKNAARGRGRPARRSAREAASRSIPAGSGQLGEHDLVGARVALGDEPDAAAGAVVPPFALDARDIGAEVVVLAELAQRWRGLRARVQLTAE